MTKTDDAAPIVPHDLAEAAMCLWEAILSASADDGADSFIAVSMKALENGPHWRGWSDFRIHILGLAPACHAAWLRAVAGGYDDPFDWHFVPDWLAGLDWSEGFPRVPSPRQPVGVTYGRPDARTEMGEALAGWLLDEMGMQVIETGGGCRALRHDGPSGWFVMVTGEDGADLPSADSWMVGAYSPADGCEGVAVFSSEMVARGGAAVARLTLAQAISAACAIVAGEQS